MSKRLFLLLCVSVQAIAMEVTTESEVRVVATSSQVTGIMNVLYQFTGTTQLETDYTVRTYLWNQLQQDPHSYASFIVQEEPTQQLLALFFNQRQQVISQIPDQVVQSFVFNKRSSIACALSSSVVALAVILWSLSACHG